MHKYEYVNIKPLYTIKSLQLALYFLYLVHLFNCSLTRVANQMAAFKHRNEDHTEFGISNMKAWLQPALYQGFRLVVVV